jgi:cell wall-associated NlpC family hydrolase
LSAATIFQTNALAQQRLNKNLVKLSIRKILMCATILASAAQAGLAAGSFPSSGPTTPGNEARLNGNLAFAPKNAPMSVKRAIWAANQLRTKPYRYGGGHKTFYDNAYDCSGTVSYALAGAGLVSVPMSSKEFRAYGGRGPGKWITVYARNGHTFAVIAGLRLDTTSPHNPSRRWAPRWQPTVRGPSGFEARHPIGL